MTVRVCLEPGCPALTRKSRCHEHERAKDKARGTREERGYGAEHRALRAEWQRRMDAGERVTCWRCAAKGDPHDVDPTRWDLGHDDLDRSVYRGPECYGNRATSGRRFAGQVTVVCGPPCSGKTTWVREQAQQGDLIVDYDDIAQRLGSHRTHDHHPSMHRKIEAVIARALAGIKAGRHERAWVIRSGVARARDLANELGGELVVLDAPDEVLCERAQQRRDPRRTMLAIREWREINASA